MEEQGLTIIEDKFLARITRFLKDIFLNKKNDNIIIDDNELEVEYIHKDKTFTQIEIINAQKAYRKYVINNSRNISNNVMSFIIEKLEENKSKIEQLISINNDDIVFEEIMSIVKNEMKNNKYFKYKENGYYQVPIGVIAVECTNTKQCIKSMLASISARNSVMILDENYNKYSTESLILLIIKECLKNFCIDDNIIQMFEKEEIDLKKVDKVIRKNSIEKCNAVSNTIFLYCESEEYKDNIQQELERLKGMEKCSKFDIKAIKGEFSDVIKFLNKETPFAVCMYTNNSTKAYKFINWVKSPNVFINTGIIKCKKNKTAESKLFMLKNVCHINIF